ncbi:hypothetical protein L1049_015072 [Liquidambar formosana]|uniref:RPN1 N-terminal domain-containing protein n=1 Tax=Liquidambar formosana TaxID=63359 RepID=A0AAP0RXD0_LIQFO
MSCEEWKKLPSKKNEKEELSDEDLALNQRVELYVEKVHDPDPSVQKHALESLREELRTSTDSMNSVPKLLKFLHPHNGTLKAYLETMGNSDLKKLLADILSVLALTMSVEGEGESLKYRLLGSESDIGSWGYEYVRNLAGEIAQEYMKRQSEEAPVDDLMRLVQQIVAFHMKHNAEPEAVDLLMEVEDLDLLVEHGDSTNFKRTCLYLTSSARYLPAPDNMLALDIAYTIYLKHGEFSNALRIAQSLDNMQYTKQIFKSCEDLLQKKQFCYMLARHGMTFELDEEMVVDDDDREALQDIINNTKLSEGYLILARDIEVEEAKSPEDIYKAQLLAGLAGAGASVDSARQNLADTFVNAFLNAAFCQDKLMTVQSESSSGGSSGNWIFKNKEHGKTSAAASLGMILLWDIDAGLAQIDKYFHSNDNHVIAGALLGVGIVNCGIKSDCDPALALLADYVDKEDSSIRIGAILGLGLAYAGAQNEQVNVVDALSRLSHDTDSEVAMAAIMSLGLIGAGTNNARIAGLLRNLSSYYYGDASLLFFVRIAQGLVHLGKGLLTLNPYHSERFLLSPTALAGIITLLHACLDMKAIILGKYHYVLYFLVLAMQVYPQFKHLVSLFNVTFFPRGS